MAGTTSYPKLSSSLYIEHLIVPLAKSLISAPNNLPPDLLLDILLRLPVKSIIRFKSVCKTWQHVLTDGLFANIHFDHPSKAETSDCLLMITTAVEGWTEVIGDAARFPKGWERVGIKRQYDFHIVGSCKGWICLAYRGDLFEIINPALRLKVSVSNPRKMDGGIHLGFGYDELHGDFKLLRLELHHSADLRFSVIEIYSLRSNSWKYNKSSENIKPTSLFPVAMLKSCLYWKSVARNDNKTTRIAVFDLSRETFHVSSPVPPLPPGKSRLDVVALRQESLALTYTNDKANILIWTMSLEDLTFKQAETCLDVPPYSAKKFLGWLRTHHGWITASQKNGDFMGNCDINMSSKGFFLFSLRKNCYVEYVDPPSLKTGPVWCFRKSLIC